MSIDFTRYLLLLTNILPWIEIESLSISSDILQVFVFFLQFKVFFYSEKQTRLYPSVNHPLIAKTLFEIAELFGRLGDLNQAKIFHQKSCDIRMSKLCPDHPDLVKSQIIFKNLL